MKNTAPGLNLHELKTMLTSDNPVTGMISSANHHARSPIISQAFVVNRGPGENNFAASRGVSPNRLERFIIKKTGVEIITKTAELVKESTVLAVHSHPVVQDSDVRDALQPTYKDISWFADDVRNSNPNIIHGIVVPAGRYLDGKMDMHLVLYGLDAAVANRGAQAKKLAREAGKQVTKDGQNPPLFIYENLGLRTVQLACASNATLKTGEAAKLGWFAPLRQPDLGIPAAPELTWARR